ncbi:MAG: GNAT family N-acetyltransferase [Deltaproteobacteria bacterium]|nr:GNAT family N-acetyltransferase [Deltaproteobacteria bacterium]
MDRSVDRVESLPSMMLRPALEADAVHLTRIERDADARFAAAGHPELADGSGIPDDVARAAIAQGRITVAEVDGAVVGWVYMGRVEAELCLGQISVEPSHGRRGVGTALLRHVIDEARRRGEDSMVLNTQSDVPWNRPWYERHGFVVVPPSACSEALRAIERDQVEHGLDWSSRVHMRLTLR